MTTTSQNLATQEGRQAANTRATLLPPVDIFEDEEGILLMADLPGVESKNLEIQVNDRVLSLEGAINVAVPSASNAVFAEVRGTRYARRFTLSRELDTDKIKADLNDGVLKLRVPKRAEHKPRRIEVKS